MADAGSRDRESKPYHGYYSACSRNKGRTRRAGSQVPRRGAMIGGFALLAWPAEYGVTGIHTFIVSHDGDVFEKDFGPKTAKLTPAIVTTIRTVPGTRSTEFASAPGWHTVLARPRSYLPPASRIIPRLGPNSVTHAWIHTPAKLAKQEKPITSTAVSSHGFPLIM